MSIVTRTGDDGTTGLVDGQRVPKMHPQVRAYGQVDELNSWIGILRTSSDLPVELIPALKRIQNECFVIGSYLASPAKPKRPLSLPSLDQLEIAAREREIEKWEKELPELKMFILPGGTPLASQLHLARAFTRRAERAVSEILEETSTPEWKTCLVYLNRLSDWFFIAARWVNFRAQVPDEPWVWKSG